MEGPSPEAPPQAERTAEQIKQDARDARPVCLVAYDGEDKSIATKFIVTRRQGRMSDLVSAAIGANDEDDEDDEDAEMPEIPIPACDAENMKLIVRFMQHHENDPMKKIEKPIKSNDIAQMVGEWDVQFMRSLTLDQIQDLVNAADYMDVEDLVDLCVCTMTAMIKGKDPDEVETLFGIKVKLDDEQRKQLRAGNPWVFETSAPPLPQAAAAPSPPAAPAAEEVPAAPTPTPAAPAARPYGWVDPMEDVE